VPESRRHFSHRVDKALDDPDLQRALTHAMTGLRARREKAFESFDFETGRADLKRRRLANLDRLPELLEQFTERLEAVGGKVHFAKDAAEARDIIAQICVNAGMRRTGARHDVGFQRTLKGAAPQPGGTTVSASVATLSAKWVGP